MPQPTTTAPAVFDALKWLAERQEVERSEGRTDRVKIRCPMPSHEDREPSCSLFKTAKGWAWHCWGCGARGNEVHIVSLVAGIPLSEAATEIERFNRLGSTAPVAG